MPVLLKIEYLKMGITLTFCLFKVFSLYFARKKKIYGFEEKTPPNPNFLLPYFLSYQTKENDIFSSLFLLLFFILLKASPTKHGVCNKNK